MDLNLEIPLIVRAVAASSDGIVVTDPNRPDHPIIYANEGFQRLTGYSQDEVLGKNCRMLQGPETDPGAIAQIRAAIRAARGCRVVLKNRRKDRSYFWNELTIDPIRDAAGRITHFVGIQKDITEHKETEEALRRAEVQLRQSQKMEAVGRLAGGVAHDFNNMLAVINGYTELLLDRGELTDFQQTSLQQIARAGKRAEDLTRQLLAFSRRQPFAPQVVDLNRLLTDVQKMLSRLIGEDIECSTHLEPRLSAIHADPGQMELALVNLVVNARDAMPDGGRLTLWTRNVVLRERRPPDLNPGTYVTLTVSDSGCGMDEATLNHIFEPFFTTKDSGKGTGLGLSTVYGIVEQHGGRIEVDSAVGQGTRFTLYFPAQDTVSANAQLPDAGETPAGGQTLLLVEDDPMVREVVSAVLEEYGYEVLAAGCGTDALLLMEHHRDRVDLLLTDVVMPGMNGMELAARVAELRPNLPVLFMSGYPKEAGAAAASDRFPLIPKPFTGDALNQRIQEILAAAAPNR